MNALSLKTPNATSVDVNDLQTRLEAMLPATLFDAERKVSALRDVRGATANDLVELTRLLDAEQRGAHQRKHTDKELTLTARLASIDADLRDARVSLRSEREKAERIIPTALGGLLRTIAPELELIASTFERIAKALQVPDIVAMRHGLPATGLASAMNELPRLRHLAKLFAEAK